MAKLRSVQVDLSKTLYYHCVSRCVRRAFLCGKDTLTGKNCNHRKSWVYNRLKFLLNIFCVKLCSYAIMSNHYHLVLYVDKEGSSSLSNKEVFERWEKLCPSNAYIYSKLSIEDPRFIKKLDEWRDKFINLSFFVKHLNEHIAKMANQEDNCKGHFWETRYFSQPLYEELDVLSAMVYVDLNPLRAGIAKKPEDSINASIYERIKHLTLHANEKYSQNLINKANRFSQPSHLMPLFTSLPNIEPKAPFIDFKLSDYLAMVDITGNILRDDKGKRTDKSINILEAFQKTHDEYINKMAPKKFSLELLNANFKTKDIR